METNLLDRMLNTYLAARSLVTVTLQNKIRMTGRVQAFDSYVIVLDGVKREILYRHAVSSITTASHEEPRRTVPVQKPAPARMPARQPKPDPRPRQTQPQQALSASSGDSSINNSMKEGLLKWMQEQKAAK
jgi:RNA chaperone Hfq